MLSALVAGLIAAPAQATPHFVVGQGQSPGVAIDAAGTAYIGWQVNTNADAGDSVQLCVLPKGARACASLATIAFPGSGLGNGQVSVLLPAPGVVEVAVARNLLNVYGYYLGTSVDGGATFNVPVRIGGQFARRAELLPGGPIAAQGDDVRTLSAAVLRPDGSDAQTDPAVLGERAQFSDVTVQGGDVYVAGSLAGPTSVAHLPADAASTDPAAWQALPDIAESDAPQSLEAAVVPGGAGVLVGGGSFEDTPIEVFQVDPHRAKVARARFGTTTVQLRADDGDCIPDTQVRLSVQAARAGLLVSPGSVLRAARISVSRSLVEHRGRWSLLVDLRRAKAKRTATVRLVPRHGHARTLRLPVLGCGRVA